MPSMLVESGPARRWARCALLLAIMAFACVRPDVDTTPAEAADSPAAHDDPHSFSRPHEVVVTHLALDLTVDFETQRLAGRATLTLDNPGGTRRLVLDTNELEIERVRVGTPPIDGRYRFGEPEAEPTLGRPLEIDIEPDTRSVEIDYATRPAAAALQWLSPEQTAGKARPFLYTQGQAVLTRSWIPCQDTPAVRSTYEATIRVPPGLMAVMSAVNETAPRADGIYRFEMAQPIPAYLIALAVGELRFASLGPRTGVYAEPAVLARAAFEFADTEAMMQATERLYGPYRWQRYDLLVLPPSFPFGGMENPRLTFLTPTILAGDRSLSALVAHELAHSWSGNLVTNASWNDLWLNEGFTTYVERRVVEELYGRETAEMLAVLGRQDLERAFDDLGDDSPETRLALDLGVRDPDDALGDVPYEKGYLFLRAIEEAVGRPAFDRFLRGYFDEHAFRSIDTQQFIEYLRDALIAGDDRLEHRLQIDRWVYATGLPHDAPRAVSAELDAVERQIAAWGRGAPASGLETEGWNAQQWVHFLRQLPNAMPPARMRELDQAFGLTESGNNEILAEWLHHVVAADYAPGFAALERFLTDQGRRKYLEPLFEELVRTPRGLAFARRVYARARPLYHSISRGTIDEIFDRPAGGAR